MKKRILLGVFLAAVAGVSVTWFLRDDPDSDRLRLHGNVDLRHVELPFKDNERIVEVLVEEGDKVASGQVLARLDVGRLRPRIAQAEAQVAAQTEVLRRLTNGSRPEEIAQARANVDSARADEKNASSRHERLQEISRTSGNRAISQLDLDEAQANLQVAQARLQSARKALQLAVAGPRVEDLAREKAQLEAVNAELELLRRQFADAELIAPMAAVVRSRLMEPGEMATPQRPVFSLALTDPKWVRVYVSEMNLGQIKPGMTASIRIDSLPDHPLHGWVGFISSMAEFTPKAVQTEDLRTSLVYEVRVFVADPEDVLRLGMPATVQVDLRQPRTVPPAKVAAAAGDVAAAAGDVAAAAVPDAR
jgi:HlyD family secretion protein